MKIAFVTDSAQAAWLMQSKLPVDEVFSLCPTASYRLRKAGYKVVTSADHYGSLSHARTTLLMAGNLDKIAAAARESYSLSDAEISGFRANLMYILSATSYIYYATRHYQRIPATFYFSPSAHMQVFTSYDDLLSALLAFTGRQYNHHYENTDYGLTHYLLARLCNRITLLISGAARKFRVVHFGDSALREIEKAIAAQTERMVVFKPRSVGKTIAQTLFVTLCNVVLMLQKKRQPLMLFRAVSPARYEQDFALHTQMFQSKLRALALRFPHPLFAHHVVNDSDWYMPFLRTQMRVGAHLAQEIAPHLTMTNKGKYHFIRSVIAHMQSGTRILINHGTHTAQPQGSISQMAANLWASDDRIMTYGITHMVPRLPLTMMQVKELCGASLPQFVILPTVKKIERHFAEPREQMKIVFAGNYVGLLRHIPWCTETADEYLLNLLELVEEMAAMERVELIIKLKASKASAHIQMVQDKIDALGAGRHIRIDTHTPFPDLLQSAHLLISNLSTTIEEAITNRVPVILHTHRKHYFHLPCAFDPPQGAGAGLVYGIKRRGNLPAMIEGIRTHYSAIVGNDKALEGLVWREDQFNNLQEFAADIIKTVNQ